jgi:DNA topoisomerase-3
MKLVIAEKPSVAADLSRVLPGTFQQHEGYWEGPGYVISWAVGHLLELAEPEDYDPELKTWQLRSLPILPQEFRRKPRSGQRKQLSLLKRLAQREDVEALVNACDAAREGELIFREIEDFLGVDKPVERLWLQSMTKQAILEAFEQIEPAERYDGLAAAAYSRAEADWLIGMNATRGITKRLKGRRERGVWSAGRVQTPTLALLVHREMRVLAHEPRAFWRLKGSFEANGHDYSAQYRSSRGAKDGEKIWDQAEAEALLKALEGQPAAASEEVSESVRKPPALYSLTALQKEANSRYGLSARRTLGAAQRLYESHKVLTYPRTDSSALPEDYRGHVDQVVEVLAGGGAAEALDEKDRAAGVAEAARTLQKDGLRNQKRNFDDSKVGDHFAIIPTGTLPSTPLGGDDAKVFELVVRRFLGAFLGPSTWQKVVRETRVETAGGPRSFYTESKRLVVPGWQAVDRRPPASEVLPDLGVEPGASAAAKVREYELEEDATRPPARLTEAGLLKAMENASDVDLDLHEEIDDEDAVEALRQKGLGTPATRADIIEALIAKGYAARSGKSLRATAKGITLVDFLERIHADHLAGAEQTAEMEFHLFQVEAGQRERSSYMEEVAERVRDLIQRLQTFDYEELYREETALGACPRDGLDVVEGLKGYRCSKVPRATHFELTVKSHAGKGAAAALAGRLERLREALLAVDKVQEVELEPKRTTAVVRVTLNRAVEAQPGCDLLVEAAQEADREEWMKACDAKPVEDDGCDFTIWKEFRGRFINRPVAEKLLGEKDSGPIEGFASMRGDFYAGRILLDEEGKMAFEPVKDFRGSDDSGSVAPELVSYPVDEAPFVHCPRCEQGRVVETPTHFECRVPGTEKGCGVRMPRTVCKREMRRSDLLPYFDPDKGHTEWIEDFISKKDRAFTARLVMKPNGRHGFEFKPREAGPRKTGKKKTAKKAAKKTTKKTARKKPVRRTAGADEE